MDLFNKTLDIPTRFYEVYGFGECSPPNSDCIPRLSLFIGRPFVSALWVASVARCARDVWLTFWFCVPCLCRRLQVQDQVGLRLG